MPSVSFKLHSNLDAEVINLNNAFIVYTRTISWAESL